MVLALLHWQRGAQSNPEELLNKEIPLKFLEVDEERTRLVLSNRKATFAENQSAFGIGSVVVGTVQTVKPYGAFIDIGGVSGLLHISQISHDRLTTVETVLSPGDKLKVLSLTSLCRSEWCLVRAHGSSRTITHVDIS